MNEISEFDGKITPYDFDEFEFLINICGNCIEIFKYNFQKTSFCQNVTSKMYELIQKYIEALSKNNAFGIKDKIQKIFPRARIVDGNIGVARRVKELL